MELRTLRYLVVVVEERHIGRAASRLHMTQPPLSRAIRALEDELGAALLVRTAHGVEPTAAGTELVRRARQVLEQAEGIRPAVRSAAGLVRVTIGTLADSTDHLDREVLDSFSSSHPHIELCSREHDLSDPSAGLRSQSSDVAFTRLPFDTTGLSTHTLTTEPIGVLARRDDPVASAVAVNLADLAERAWVRLPPTADPTWLAYWTGGRTAHDDPVARTVQECVQAVLWSRRLALAPLGQRVPPALTLVRTVDRPASRLVVAWDPARLTPATRAFIAGVRTAGAAVRRTPKHQGPVGRTTAVVR